jgi:hypothetical protein
MPVPHPHAPCPRPGVTAPAHARLTAFLTALEPSKRHPDPRIEGSLPSPLRSVDILPRVRRLLAHTGTRDPLQQVRRAALGLRELIGNSPEFLGQLERIPRVSRCDAGS